MRQALFLVLVAGLMASCGGKSGIDPEQDAKDAARAQKNCDDPKWKEEHLGVWYSVCRPNAAVR